MARALGKARGSSHQAIFDGPPMVGGESYSEVFRHEEIVRGIQPSRVKRLIERGVLPAKQVYRVIPERTFGRRLAKAEPLKAKEADALGRLLRVTEQAFKAFGDVHFARRWLDLRNPALDDRIPIELAETDAGAREVEAVLTRIADGVYS
jgi:putative toxin-antitoxin system antitoxin component (TIGR02293 family)